MKIRQTVRHWATKRALATPVLGEKIRAWLVEMHTEVFLERAPDGRVEDRRAHLTDFFEATIDVYETALAEGYPEARAREITHVVANFDFYGHGWTEMMEFPQDELVAHYERYRAFFEAHDISVEDPLGEFRPEAGIASAPGTPEKLADPTHPHAVSGYADDVYVETDDGAVVRGGTDEPRDGTAGRTPGGEEGPAPD